MKHFNYIFTGSGLSALMTIYEMILSKKFSDISILLIDADAKKTNDRTWCFWDDSNLFENIISKKWTKAFFANEKWNKNLEINQYTYNMIQGLDFYNLVFNAISKHSNIEFINQKVLDFLIL